MHKHTRMYVCVCVFDYKRCIFMNRLIIIIIVIILLFDDNDNDVDDDDDDDETCTCLFQTITLNGL